MAFISVFRGGRGGQSVSSAGLCDDRSVRERGVQTLRVSERFRVVLEYLL